MIKSANIVHSVQSAVAPVFMLTAVAAMIGALATRLARIIDRARWIEERLDLQRIKNEEAAYWELKRLGLRGSVVNWSIALLVLCALFIGATVAGLFLDEILDSFNGRLVPWSFLGGVFCFSVSLICFLAETLLATHTLRFAKQHTQHKLPLEMPSGTPAPEAAPQPPLKTR